MSSKQVSNETIKKDEVIIERVTTYYPDRYNKDGKFLREGFSHELRHQSIDNPPMHMRVYHHYGNRGMDMVLMVQNDGRKTFHMGITNKSLKFKENELASAFKKLDHEHPDFSVISLANPILSGSDVIKLKKDINDNIVLVTDGKELDEWNPNNRTSIRGSDFHRVEQVVQTYSIPQMKQIIEIINNLKETEKEFIGERAAATKRWYNTEINF